MPDLAWIAVGGAFGAVLRHHLVLALGPGGGRTHPWAILTVNLVACFVLGTLVGATQRGEVPTWLFLVGATGFCGALSTWSSLAADLHHLIGARRWAVAAVDLAAHLVGGIALLGIGIALAG